ncbi:ran-binding protein 1 homolog c-like isoform X2 [Phoenix dactylifera]|uniref:Ran-binding protein 1 homolog c-like isoform X2 n=1 Tax=Phoenix dactylifera TaxID=42345 RepID=A0A8B7CRX7_PHODC|nr:ran-binding protein 1 homolog c-like isoform X2 [Phoenix dactylifera]
MASADPERRDEVEAGEVAGGEEEDTGAQIAPIIRLEEVAVTTGEEEEDVLLDLKAKLYRFDKEGKQWKERGTGNVKLLKHKESGKVRLVMRQAKTLKICANHLVLPSIKMQEHVGNDKSCVWHAVDFSEGELKEEMFCIRLGSVEISLCLCSKTARSSRRRLKVLPNLLERMKRERARMSQLLLDSWRN